MIPQVRLPDGTARHPNSSGQCADLMQEIGAEHAAASADGRRIDAERWAKAHDDAFALLPRLMIADLIEEKSKLQPIKRHAELCANWWLDLQGAIHGKEPVEVSPAQHAILNGNRFAPASWQEAREAIDLRPEFRRPERLSLSEAISRAGKIYAAATDVEKAISDCIAALQDMQPPWDTWKEFERWTYPGFLVAHKDFTSAVKALDA